MFDVLNLTNLGIFSTCKLRMYIYSMFCSHYLIKKTVVTQNCRMKKTCCEYAVTLSLGLNCTMLYSVHC